MQGANPVLSRSGKHCKGERSLAWSTMLELPTTVAWRTSPYRNSGESFGSTWSALLPLRRYAWKFPIILSSPACVIREVASCDTHLCCCVSASTSHCMQCAVATAPTIPVVMQFAAATAQAPIHNTKCSASVTSGQC